jgi:alkylresorcinol/alkylpyrone synthase
LTGSPEELALFDRAGVRTRNLAFPLDYYFAGHGFARRNRDWRATALTLGEAAIRGALDRAGVALREVGHLFFLTTTGLATPSVDALLAERMGFRRTVLRSPLFGVGCAGGAVGIARAADWLSARPGGRAVVLSVELCGQTWLAGDLGKANLVGAALFGDGAAAVVLAGAEAAEGKPGLEVAASASELLPDSRDLMGWDFTDEGFRLVLSRRVPTAVREHVAPRIGSFIERMGLTPAAVPHWIVHPGGPKVLDAYASAFGLDAAALRWTREVLRDHGNLSSATVLAGLARFLDDGPRAEPGDPAILSAVGPGFAVETLLLRWAE